MVRMTEDARKKLFFFGCIPVRVAMIVAVFHFWNHHKARLIMGAMGLTIATTHFAVDWARKNHLIPNRGGTGGRPWWSSVFHGVMYMAFSQAATMNHWSGPYILAADVLAGFALGVHHYFM